MHVSVKSLASIMRITVPFLGLYYVLYERKEMIRLGLFLNVALNVADLYNELAGI